MDQDVINLAKAIRQTETGNRAVSGKSGELPSRYQFMPSTWRQWSKEVLGIENAPLTLENENKVAYTKIKNWKDSGYNPAQIASMWNSGKPDWKGKKGVNKYGVAYDVPSYVNKVYSTYQQVKASSPSLYQPQTQKPVVPTVQEQRNERMAQGLPVAKNPERVEPTFGGTIARDILKTPAKVLESFKAIGKQLGGQSYEEAVKPRESKYFGGEIAPLGTKGNFGQNLKETIGAGVELGSYYFPGGVATRSAKMLPGVAKNIVKPRQILKTLGRNVAEGTIGAVGFEEGKKLQGEEDRLPIVKSAMYGAGGGLAFGIGGQALGKIGRELRRTGSAITGNIPQDIAEESVGRLKGAWKETIDNYKTLRDFRSTAINRGVDIEEVLTREVLTPEIKGGTVDTTLAQSKVSSRIDEAVNQVAELAKSYDDIPVKLDDFSKKAEKVIRNNESIMASGKVNTAVRDLRNRIAGFKEAYGDTVNASVLNRIRIEMNKEFKDALADKGIKDVATAIGDAVRDQLDEIIDDSVFRRANKRAGELITAQRFLKRADGRKVGGGRFSQAFAGIVGAGAVGAEKLPLVGPLVGYLGGRKLQKVANQYAFGKAGPRTRSILQKMGSRSNIPEEIAGKTIKREPLYLPPAKPGSIRTQVSNNTPLYLGRRAPSTVDIEERADILMQRIKKGDDLVIDGERVKVVSKADDGVVVKDDKGSRKFVPKQELSKQAYGAVAGFGFDDEGNLEFSKERALMGVGGLAVAKKAGLMKGAKSVSEDLMKEARKYKSADEFVKAQTELRQYKGGLDSVAETMDIKKIKPSQFGDDISMDTAESYVKGGRADNVFTHETINLEKLTSEKQLPPIVVDDNFKIIDGNHRYTALKIAGLDRIRVVRSETLKEIWKEVNKKPKVNPLKPYKGEKDLTTKILKDLEGKTTVSKQYILDATNRGELKQAERDLIRAMVENEPKEINVNKFAKKVKAELLPLKVNKARDMYSTARGGTGGRYENITLPDELRGNVKNYEERIYESPIKTSAGEVHFGQPKDKVEGYFGHTRIEDMADGKTRRVIEVQSDLYQKGNLERETDQWSVMKGDESVAKIGEKELTKRLEGRKAEVSKLQQYNNPTAHFRMVREEIKKASQDGKTKLQFPTGETAMKIEGLGQNTQWIAKEGGNYSGLKPDNLKVGLETYMAGQESQKWIITDVLGDGKFKAVQKSFVDIQPSNWKITLETESGKVMPESSTEKGLVWVARNEKNGKMEFQPFAPSKKQDALTFLKEKIGSKDMSIKELGEVYGETFDISGKVDTNNPIYKFYEKDLQKYLNKFGGKKVVDKNGVSWIEVPVKKEWAKMPVEAFALFPFLKSNKDEDDRDGLLSRFFGKRKKDETTPEMENEQAQANLDEPKEVVYLANREKAIDPPEEIKKSIEKAYKRNPDIPKGFIEAVLMMESSMATNPANKNNKIGEFAWVGGITEIAKKQFDKMGKDYDLSTLDGAIQMVADYIEMRRKFVNIDGTVRYINDPIKLYIDRYNGFGIAKKWGEKKLQERKEDLKKLIAYYGA